MKNLKYFFLFSSFLILLWAPLDLFAQTETQVAKGILSHIQSSNGVRVTFSLKNPQFEGTILGTYSSYKNMFYVETDLIKAWYNGELLWVMQTGTNEVNLSKPTSEDLEDVILFSRLDLLLTDDFKLKMTQNNNGYFLVATPTQNYNGNFSSIEIVTNKESLPVTILVSERGIKDKTTINVEKIKPLQSIPLSTFTFDTKEHPNAQVIDLR